MRSFEKGLSHRQGRGDGKVAPRSAAADGLGARLRGGRLPRHYQLLGVGNGTHCRRLTTTQARDWRQKKKGQEVHEILWKII